MKGVDFTGIAYLVGFALVGWIAYEVIVNRKAIGQAVDVTSPDNLAYKASTSIVRAVTGDSTGTLGTKIYDFFHPGEDAAIKAPVRVTPKAASNDPWGDALRAAATPEEQSGYVLGVGGL